MPEPLRPAPAKLYGRKNYIYIPTIASATLAPTVAEITGASALDITNISFAGAEPMLNSSVERVKQDQRAGDTEAFEFLGSTSYEGGDIIMSLDTQAAAASNAKKAWEKFLEGTVGFIAKRGNVGRAVNVSAGQFLTYVLPVEFSKPVPLEQGEGIAGQEAFRSSFAVTSTPAFVIAVLA